MDERLTDTAGILHLHYLVLSQIVKDLLSTTDRRRSVPDYSRHLRRSEWEQEDSNLSFKPSQAMPRYQFLEKIRKPMNK